jgi:hypothetical protein
MVGVQCTLDLPNSSVTRKSVAEKSGFFAVSVLPLDSQRGPVDVDENRVSITMPPADG